MEFNEFERKVKETAEVVAEKAEQVAKAVGKKATDIVEETRINSKIKEISSLAKKKISKLGQLAYEGRGIIEDAEVAQTLVEEIDACYRDIKKLKREVARIKGEILCESCEAYNKPGSKFCNNCGESLEEEPVIFE